MNDCKKIYRHRPMGFSGMDDAEMMDVGQMPV